jgi:expansin (peptidoglycan-binding protein)
MDGWTDRPKCFKFLEGKPLALSSDKSSRIQPVCNTPKKCVFVRVVDTCAGCAPGSKHIDMTRAAFAQLAELDVGVVKVQFRSATDPKTWQVFNHRCQL